VPAASADRPLRPPLRALCCTAVNRRWGHRVSNRKLAALEREITAVHVSGSRARPIGIVDAGQFRTVPRAILCLDTRPRSTPYLAMELSP
jgi:hypothetical protein